MRCKLELAGTVEAGLASNPGVLYDLSWTPSFTTEKLHLIPDKKRFSKATQDHGSSPPKVGQDRKFKTISYAIYTEHPCINPRPSLISSPSMNSVMSVLPFRDRFWLPMIRRSLAPRLMHTFDFHTCYWTRDVNVATHGLPQELSPYLQCSMRDKISQISCGADADQLRTSSRLAHIYHKLHTSTLHLHVCDAGSAGGPTFSRWASSSRYENKTCAWIGIASGSRVLPLVGNIYPTNRYCSSPMKLDIFWVRNAIFSTTKTHNLEGQIFVSDIISWTSRVFLTGFVVVLTIWDPFTYSHVNRAKTR